MGWKRMLLIQAGLAAVAVAAHLLLIALGAAKYTKADPRLSDIVNLVIQSGTTAGMTNCIPDNALTQAVCSAHTVAAFSVLVAGA